MVWLPVAVIREQRILVQSRPMTSPNGQAISPTAKHEADGSLQMENILRTTAQPSLPQQWLECPLRAVREYAPLAVTPAAVQRTTPMSREARPRCPLAPESWPTARDAVRAQRGHGTAQRNGERLQT